MRLTAEAIEIIFRVNKVFKDPEKTRLWLTEKNLGLGGISPLYLINVGRSHKVIEFIRNSRQGGQPEES